MANVKISALPTWSGTAADLRWFVMNNSGETETFKFSGYTSPYKRVSTNNSNNIYDTNAMGAGQFNTIIGGSSNTLSSDSDFNAIVGGTSNTISAGNRTRNGMLGGSGNSITNGDYSVILGAADSTSTASFAAILAGYGNNNNTYCGVVGGYGNTNGGEVNMIFGNQCSTQGACGGIIGARSSQLQGNTSTNIDCFIGGGNTNIIATSIRTTILGGDINTITSSPYSSIIGGTGNTLSGKTSVVMLGCSGRTASTSGATFVENLVVFNYASLDYADDTAAAAGGVVLGQIYHTSGAMKIRIT